jgi:hypothetical protein
MLVGLIPAAVSDKTNDPTFMTVTLGIALIVTGWTTKLCAVVVLFAEPKP